MKNEKQLLEKAKFLYDNPRYKQIKSKPLENTGDAMFAIGIDAMLEMINWALEDE